MSVGIRVSAYSASSSRVLRVSLSNSDNPPVVGDVDLIIGTLALSSCGTPLNVVTTLFLGGLVPFNLAN